MKTPELPENAPFDSAQRAWLNGYIAAVLTGADDTSAAAAESDTDSSDAAEPGGVDDEPWHDPGLSLDERTNLAAGRPLADQLMAATANEDCGACGYDCRSYAEALANGTETDTTLCRPGGNETRKQLKSLLATDA